MLLFDFDGVLADSLHIYTEICTQAAQNQGYQAELPPNPFAELDKITFEALALQLGLCPSTFTADATLLLKQRRDIAPTFVGMIETLRRLSSETPLGILSASPKAFIQRFIGYHEISEFFSVLLTRDDPGTKAEKIIAIRQQGTYSPLALVGDGVSDISAAASAGISSIGVSWGWQMPEKLQNAGADFIAETPAQIQTFLSYLQT
ncbi:HAD family hydrolase [Cognatishimia maritima]|uniref:Haloacid dehalogenase-like hydrolase n=1 Tax=Cognatishimia maritima TaxID=870908 RepID=A0A1M5QRB9_9RHOB|nr:HAD-IA family hydrolase [Cognatishimia maritima]SHH16320.1 Haloacid dehalogenase-like hydrolase [Cognatishimia maritima]